MKAYIKPHRQWRAKRLTGPKRKKLRRDEFWRRMYFQSYQNAFAKGVPPALCGLMASVAMAVRATKSLALEMQKTGRAVRGLMGIVGAHGQHSIIREMARREEEQCREIIQGPSSVHNYTTGFDLAAPGKPSVTIIPFDGRNVEPSEPITKIITQRVWADKETGEIIHRFPPDSAK